MIYDETKYKIVCSRYLVPIKCYTYLIENKLLIYLRIDLVSVHNYPKSKIATQTKLTNIVHFYIFSF